MRHAVDDTLVVCDRLPCKIADGILDVLAVLVKQSGKVDQRILLGKLCILVRGNSEQDIVVRTAGNLQQQLLVRIVGRKRKPLRLVAGEFLCDFPGRLLLIVVR